MLPASVEVVLLRAAQEALTNVGRHAGATGVNVTLTYNEHDSTLTVKDDGRGFNPATVKGYGLGGMRVRAKQVGGHLHVQAADGAGTTVTVVV